MQRQITAIARRAMAMVNEFADMYLIVTGTHESTMVVPIPSAKDLSACVRNSVIWDS